MTNRVPLGRGWGGRPLPALLAALLAPGLAGCDFPTEIPKWDTTWVVPAENTTVAVTTLLPAAIALGPVGTSFVLNLQPVTVSRSLGQMCSPGCPAANGLTIPKPAFTTAFETTVALPADVVSAQATGGTILLALSHDLPFDPIRPSATARGYMVVTASLGSTIIAKDSIAGEAVAFAPGVTLDRTLTLAAPNITGPFTITTTLYSPAGDPVTIDTSDALRLTVTPEQIQVSQAQIRVSSRTIDATEVDLDLGDIDETVTDRTKAGALLLTFANPFAVTGSMTLTITTPSITITRPVTLAEGTSTARVEFNQQEIQAILGASPVRLRVSGAVCPTSACTTTVTPSQELSIATRLELTIGPKED